MSVLAAITVAVLGADNATQNSLISWAPRSGRGRKNRDGGLARTLPLRVASLIIGECFADKAPLPPLDTHTTAVPEGLVAFNSSAGEAMLINPRTSRTSFMQVMQHLGTQKTQVGRSPISHARLPPSDMVIPGVKGPSQWSETTV